MRLKCTIIGAIAGGIFFCLIFLIIDMFSGESSNSEVYSNALLSGVGVGAIFGFMLSPYKRYSRR